LIGVIQPANGVAGPLLLKERQRRAGHTIAELAREGRIGAGADGRPGAREGTLWLVPPLWQITVAVLPAWLRTGDDSDPNNGGGFAVVRHDGPDRTESEAQYDARMRAKFGDDAVERAQRSRALSKNPRQLTDGEKAVLRHRGLALLRAG
jgi:hypothetical protein